MQLQAFYEQMSSDEAHQKSVQKKLQLKLKYQKKKKKKRKLKKKCEGKKYIFTKCEHGNNNKIKNFL
jgi:hypothetical protein